MGKVIVIRHSDGNSYKDYVGKNGLHFTRSLQEYASK